VSWCSTVLNPGSAAPKVCNIGVKSSLDTRPIFHKRDDTIRGHVFCGFLALALRKEFDRRLLQADHSLRVGRNQAGLEGLATGNHRERWPAPFHTQPKQRRLEKIFESVGVVMPPAIQEA